MNAAQDNAGPDRLASGQAIPRQPWQPPALRAIHAASAEIGVNNHTNGNFTQS